MIACVFYWRNFTTKLNFKYSKIKRFWRFSTAKSEGKKLSNFYAWFSMCSQYIEGWLNICTSFLVYSQIRLNIPRHDHHFFYIFLCMIATLATNKNSLKTHCLDPNTSTRLVLKSGAWHDPLPSIRIALIRILVLQISFLCINATKVNEVAHFPFIKAKYYRDIIKSI